MANVIAVADTCSIKVHCLLSFLNTVQRTKREVTSWAFSGLFILHSGHVLQPICRCKARFRQIRHPGKRFLEQFMGYTASSRQFADIFKRIQESNQTVDERPSLSLSPVVSDVVSQGDRKIVLTSQVLTLANGNLAWRPMKSPAIRREQRQMTTKEMKQMGRLLKK